MDNRLPSRSPVAQFREPVSPRRRLRRNRPGESESHRRRQPSPDVMRQPGSADCERGLRTAAAPEQHIDRAGKASPVWIGANVKTLPKKPSFLVINYREGVQDYFEWTSARKEVRERIAILGQYYDECSLTMIDLALTRARIAIGAAAIAAENRADDRQNNPGRRLGALHEADRLWDEALGYLGDEADHWSRRGAR